MAKDVEYIKQQILETFAHAENKTLTVEMVKEFLDNIINHNPFFDPYAELKQGGKSSSVSLVYKDLNKGDPEGGVKGEFMPGENSIYIDENYLKEVVEGKKTLEELIQTASHEYRHYVQHNYSAQYDKLREENSHGKAGEKTSVMTAFYDKFQSMRSYRKESIAYLSQLVGEELTEEEVGDISYAIYAQRFEEKDARMSAITFTEKLTLEVEKALGKVKNAGIRKRIREGKSYIEKIKFNLKIDNSMEEWKHNRYSERLDKFNEFLSKIKVTTLLDREQELASQTQNEDERTTKLKVIKGLAGVILKDKTDEELYQLFDHSMKLGCSSVAYAVRNELEARKINSKDPKFEDFRKKQCIRFAKANGKQSEITKDMINEFRFGRTELAAVMKEGKIPLSKLLESGVADEFFIADNFYYDIRFEEHGVTAENVQTVYQEKLTEMDLFFGDIEDYVSSIESQLKLDASKLEVSKNEIDKVISCIKNLKLYHSFNGKKGLKTDDDAVSRAQNKKCEEFFNARKSKMESIIKQLEERAQNLENVAKKENSSSTEEVANDNTPVEKPVVTPKKKPTTKKKPASKTPIKTGVKKTPKTKTGTKGTTVKTGTEGAESGKTGTEVVSETPVTGASGTGTTVVENGSDKKGDAIVADTPVADAPAVDTPVADEPAVDTPVADAPAVDTPVAEAPAVETPAAEAPAVDTPVAEAPAVDTPVADEPAVDAVASDSTGGTGATTTENGDKKAVQFDEFMNKYTSFMQGYYSGNKGTRGHAHSKEEQSQRRKLNYAMKKYLAKQISDQAKADESVKNGTKTEQDVINQLTNPVNENDMNELVTNPTASLKLFQIMSSGVYEKDGKKIRLTQKQRMALASALTQVAEKQLNNSSDKAKQTVKGMENTGIERTQ